MKKRKLAKIEAELRQLRGSFSNIKSKTLKSLARRLGRERKAGFTNEPTYVRKHDPALSPPLSIPAHTILKPGTARNIVQMLLDDVDAWKEFIHLHGESEESDDLDNASGDLDLDD